MERLSVFPAFHKVAGRVVLVVGDGAAALAKVRLLLETEAEIRLVSAAPSDALSALVAAHAIEHRRRGFLAADLDGAVLAFAASGERAADEAVIAAARARNIPANAVDNPDLCDFYTPAIVNRAPVAIAITSTGAGPVLAQKLRARIEAMLPPRLGALARLGESFRAAADRVLPKGQPRRRFWSAFFEGRVADAALSGRIEEARRLASRLLTKADFESRGFVWLVGAGPCRRSPDASRAARPAGSRRDRARRSCAGRRDRAGPPRRRADRGQLARRHRGALLVREAGAGRRVVRLTIGDPATSESAAIAALRTAKIPFEVVPGVHGAVAQARVLAA